MQPAEFDPPAPFPSLSAVVSPEWIDSNEHMNVSRYDQLFDAAESAFYASCGIDRRLQVQRRGLFRLEKHLRYQREMRLGAGIAITTQLIWTDLKRVHVFHEMWDGDEGYRAATMECMAIHVNLETRKPVTFDVPLVRDRIEAMARAHAALPLPDGAGRSVGRASAR